MTLDKINYPIPSLRRLQVFSLDPAADIELDTAMISRSTIEIPWEEIAPGPIGEYLEVIDFDPASDCVYDPIDLSKTLTSNGLDPSTGNPQFHQQMVYAVASLTISNFERILGRKVIWSERTLDKQNDYLGLKERFVRRLRIYPHALRDQNAYYSSSKKALLFGYFNAPTTDPREGLPGGIVFTCLSHDIVAHETTHAILDGIHRRLLQPSNKDMLAFHEAFSDIVAIFQHFSLPNLLLDQIQRTRGNLDHDNLLAQLATQFARSTGRGNALRNALGEFDTNGQRAAPDPSALGRAIEPHDRGAILVAAVYDAFFRIYQNRVADLRRIATNGTGVLPAGDIHPDLAKRFAYEASHAANRVLTVCIRAIDYLPAVDIDFGDYLRALISADADVVPDDPRHYRLAFIEAFRNHGIYPVDVRALSEESLRWTRLSGDELEQFGEYLPSAKVLRTMTYAYETGNINAMELLSISNLYLTKLKEGDFDGAEKEFLKMVWVDDSQSEDGPSLGDEDRRNSYLLGKAFAIFLKRWIEHKAKLGKENTVRNVERLLGIDLTPNSQEANFSKFEVHAIRPTVRAFPDGRSKTQLIVILTQRVIEPLLNINGVRMADELEGKLTFCYRGGCTLLIDPEHGVVEYAISKNIVSEERKKRQMQYLSGRVAELGRQAIDQFSLSDGAAAKKLQRFEHIASIHGETKGSGEY